MIKQLHSTPLLQDMPVHTHTAVYHWLWGSSRTKSSDFMGGLKGFIVEKVSTWIAKLTWLYSACSSLTAYSFSVLHNELQELKLQTQFELKSNHFLEVLVRINSVSVHPITHTHTGQNPSERTDNDTKAKEDAHLAQTCHNKFPQWILWLRVLDDWGVLTEH